MIPEIYSARPAIYSGPYCPSLDRNAGDSKKAPGREPHAGSEAPDKSRRARNFFVGPPSIPSQGATLVL